MSRCPVFNLDDALGPVEHDPERFWVMGEIGRKSVPKDLRSDGCEGVEGVAYECWFGL